MALCATAPPQTTPTQSPGQTPKTAPQTKQVLPSYEGQQVTSVELAGRPDLKTAQFLPLLTQHAGEPFSQAKVDQSIAALERAGQFNNVQLDVRPEADGIRVLFVLQPAIYFGIFEFPGADKFPYSRLLQVTDYPPRGEYTDYEVSRAQNALATYLRRVGYFLAEVRPELEMHKESGIVDVIFHVTLNRRAKFGQVEITGATPQETQFLEAAVHSTMARLRTAAIRPGKTYKLRTLQTATRFLESRLAKQGYLSSKVRLIGAKYNPENNRADINFHVDTGPVIHVNLAGGRLWPWTRHKLLPVYQGVGVDQEVIQEGRQNLVSYFQSKGHFDAKVDAEVQQQPSGELIVYHITQGPRHKVAEVAVSGNSHFAKKELLPKVTVEKGRFFFLRGKYSQKLVRESVKNLENTYKASGYSSVKVTPVTTNRGGNLAVTFQINEGEQDIVADLRMEGNNTLSEAQLAPKGLKVVPGQGYSQKAVDEDRNQILARYLELGYLTATLRQSARQLPKQPHRIEVVYRIYEGPRVQTASVVTLGRRVTSPRIISMNTSDIHSGSPLTESGMLQSETRLYTLGVFDWAEVDPRRRITTQDKEDVIIKVHESKRNTLTYGFGFEVINRGGNVPSGTVAVPGLPPVGLPQTFTTSQKTYYGPRGTLEFSRSNLWGRAESLTASLLGARLDQRGSLTYTNPSFRWTKWTSNLTFSGEHNSENPIFSSTQGLGGMQFQHPLNPNKTQNIFLRYNFSQTALTRLLIPGLVPPQDVHVRLSTLSGLYIRDTRDSAIDAHKGIYESFQLDMNPSVLGSSVNFGKLTAQGAYYKKIVKDIIFANSLRIGAATPFSNSHVPISQEFFSGGGSTLRGFPLNGAGPQRTIPACGIPGNTATCSLITVPLGGRELLIVNSEFRIPLDSVKKNLGMAAFYDGGNVFRSIGFHGHYTNSIGAGLRYSTPVGPVRFDIGHNLNAPSGIKATQIFITLGQAF